VGCGGESGQDSEPVRGPRACVNWQSDGRGQLRTTAAPRGGVVGKNGGSAGGPQGALVSQGPSGCLVGAVWTHLRKGRRYRPSAPVPRTIDSLSAKGTVPGPASPLSSGFMAIVRFLPRVDVHLGVHSHGPTEDSTSDAAPFEFGWKHSPGRTPPRPARASLCPRYARRLPRRVPAFTRLYSRHLRRIANRGLCRSLPSGARH
jgi:hypothetical protein